VLSLRTLKLVLACLAAAGSCAGCRSGSPQNGSIAPIELSRAHYAFLFGQSYRTKTDLYVFSFTRETEPLYYLGTRANGLALGPKALPDRITTENIGKIFEAPDGPNDIIIAGVAPAGSLLTVRAETHEVTMLSGVRGSGGYPMGFIGDLVYDGRTNSVLTEFVQSHKTVAEKVPNQDISDTVAEKIP
jgi:hypothetical protein